jgi:nucleoside-diphosphate-sugar epimerase
MRVFVAGAGGAGPNARTDGAVMTDDDPLDPDPPAAQAKSLAGIRYLEQAVLDAPLDGFALRYGSFYGLGASDVMVDLVRRRKLPLVGDARGNASWIHVDDAAGATVVATGWSTRRSRR